MIKNSFVVLICIFVYSFIYIFHFPVHAQENGGIEVSPSIIQLDFATDTPQTTLTYTNHTTQPITLTFSSSDVTDAGDSYNVAFLSQKDAKNFRYGLSSWIQFSNSSLLLNPGEKATQTIFIDKEKLSPGGHYGSILAHIETGSGPGNLSVKSILATLIFVRTHTGKEFEKGVISTFTPEQNFWDFPKSFLLRFTNSGDTYLTPYGTATVSDIWGNTVGKGILNSGSLLVLPESLRRMEIPIQTTNNIVWPSIYHAALSLQFGKTNQYLTSTTTFFSFGTLPVAQILIGILVLGNFYLFFRRRHGSTSLTK